MSAPARGRVQTWAARRASVLASVLLTASPLPGVVTPPPLSAPSNLLLPTISGIGEVGQTLVANSGAWSGNPSPTLTGQWLRDGVATGVTGSSYLLVSADVGATITYRETATNSQGSASATSSGLGPISSAGGGPVATGFTYDTAIGNGVGADGFADLPLRSGAKYIYVNNAIGNDTTGTGTAAAPYATIAKGATKITNGAGDQVLVAQGQSFAEGLPNLTNKNGFSPLYPTVIQTYDPADPTNTAKFGRGVRPVLTAGTVTFINNQGAGTNNIAIRGLKLDAGNVAGLHFAILGAATGQSSNFLFENVIFAYQQLNIMMNNALPTRGLKYILRNCAFYGSWINSSTRIQGMFTDYIDGMTCEDTVFWHSGWWTNATRGDPANSGGATIYNHPIYAQDTTRNNVVRRCVFIDCSNDGGRLKGDALYQYNLSINNPAGVDIGRGESYFTDSPLGNFYDISWNVVLGTVATGAWGIHVGSSSRPGTWVRGNVVAQNPYAGGYGLMIDAAVDDKCGGVLPAYVDFDGNMVYGWAAAGQSLASGMSHTVGTDVLGRPFDYRSLMHYTANNNAWDDPALGTNVNKSTASVPNAYTVTSLMAALGYGSLAAAQADWIANPEQRGWRNGVALALAGYGRVQSLADIRTSLAFTIGMPSSAMLVGTLDGSTITCADLPAGLTLDSGGRTIRYDGSQSPSSGSCHLVETNGTSTRTTTIPWSFSARPVLSSLVVTPGNASATATINAAVGSGTLYWEAHANPAVPEWQNVRAGYGATPVSPPDAKVFGSQPITAPGTQTINIAGLDNDVSINIFVAQLDGGGNPSLTSEATVTPVAGSPPAVLSSPTATPVGKTSATLGVTTDTGAGTLYWVLSTSATAPTAAQIEAGQDSSGSAAAAFGSQPVTTAGAQTINATGSYGAGTYYAHFAQKTSVYSNVVDAASFTTTTTPVVRTSASSMSGGTTAVTRTFGTGAAIGNFAIAIVETSNQTVVPPAGWTLFDQSGFGSPAAIGSTSLAILYNPSISSTDLTNGITIADTGDHQLVSLMTFSGVNTTTPIIRTMSGSNSVAGTAVSIATPVNTATIKATDLALAVVGFGVDMSGSQAPSGVTWSGITGTNSTIIDYLNLTGNGGGLMANQLTPSATQTAAPTFACSVTNASEYNGSILVLKAVP